jgi:hypothetical protein
MFTPDELIRQRWPEPDMFYRERDQRTELEVRNLHSYVFRQVEIHVDPEQASDVTVQRIALTAANLTGRWARNVTVVVPKVHLAVTSATETTLGGQILLEMRAADPFGSFRVGDRAPTHLHADKSPLRLFVGPWENSESLVRDDYVIGASGWTAQGRRGTQSRFERRWPGSAAAATLAASIGAGDLFKRAVGHSPSDWLNRLEWSTWSHDFGRHLESAAFEPRPPEVADIGNVLLAGAGAVGSALLYVLSLGPVLGRFTVVDRDQVDTSNLNRSPLFTAYDAATCRNKTDVAGALLHRMGLDVREILGTWREVGEPLSREPFDVWVSLTNEDAAWAEVPHQLPPVVLHGTTTSGWGVAFGRHIPRVEDCTFCRLPRPAAEFRGPCAQGDIAIAAQSNGPRASLPFLSTVAASLLAAELTKLELPGVIAQPNAVEADFRSGLPTVLKMFRSATPGCPGCDMATLDVWSVRGGRSRYVRLSQRR